MVKRNIYRGDVFMADLSSLGLVDEPHPILCISNWKNNIKNSKINFVQLTSTFKSYDTSHYDLDIKKYKLTKEISTVCCENIYTIEKEKLLYKMFKIDNKDMIKIDIKISTQLQLFDGKYNYLNDEDLEELFIEENIEVEYEKEELTKIKCEIYDLLEKDKEYDRCIIRCYEFIDIVNSSTKVNRNDFLFYIYHIMSKCYLKKKEWKNCLDKSKLSLKHMNKPTEFSYQYSLVLWDIARSYEELQQIEYSKRVYNSLEKYFKSNNYYIMAKSIAFNIAKIDKHIEKMLELKQELINLQTNESNYFTNEKYKEYILNEMTNEINNLVGGV